MPYWTGKWFPAPADQALTVAPLYIRRAWNSDRRTQADMYAVNWDLVDRLGLDRTALAGQTALVTGGARGIGEGAATTMAALGARVVVVDKLPTGQAVADAIEAAGGQARFIECDLSVVDELMAMIPQAIAAFGQIDILVNNALHATVAPLVALDLAEWERDVRHQRARAVPD